MVVTSSCGCALRVSCRFLPGLIAIITIPAKMAMMATTSSTSSRVKPFCVLYIMVLNRIIQYSFPVSLPCYRNCLTTFDVDTRVGNRNASGSSILGNLVPITIGVTVGRTLRVNGHGGNVLTAGGHGAQVNEAGAGTGTRLTYLGRRRSNGGRYATEVDAVLVTCVENSRNIFLPLCITCVLQVFTRVNRDNHNPGQDSDNCHHQQDFK